MSVSFLLAASTLTAVTGWVYAGVGVIVGVVVFVAMLESDDRGSGSVVAAFAVALLWPVALVVFLVAGLLGTRRRRGRASERAGARGTGHASVVPESTLGQTPPSLGETVPTAAVHAPPTSRPPVKLPAVALPPFAPASAPTSNDVWELSITLREDLDLAAVGDRAPAYASGLETLANGDARGALSLLRSVVEADDGSRYSSAVLLVCLLSLQVDDIETFRALHKTASENTPPDEIAVACVATSTLWVHYPDSLGDIDFPDVIARPLLASHLAVAASLIALGETQEAAKTLEEIIDPSQQISGEPSQNHSAFADASRPTRGIDHVLMRLYTDIGDIDAVLDVIERYPDDWRKDLVKAGALIDKGIPDSALVVYDEIIKSCRSVQIVNRARYAKSALLQSQGKPGRARRELAILYADAPSYPDTKGLWARLDATMSTSREPIPQQVRHAVWQRDGGKCQGCGSQEKLEYDHIIPISRGGANTERNLQLLCEPCNRAKGADI